MWRAIRRLLPSDRSFTGLGWWVIDAFMIPAIAVLILVMGTSLIGGAWAAAHGQGTAGTFTVTGKECDVPYRSLRTVCTALDGSFTSDNGRVHLRTAMLDTVPRGATNGSRIRTVFEGDRDPAVVYLNRDSSSWIIWLLLMIAGTVALIVWALTTWAKLTSRRLPWMPPVAPVEGASA